MRLQSREDLIADLQSKQFRDAFVSIRVSNTLALQIRAMRQERGWSQAYLAELLGTSQNAVYRLESPQYGRPSITTLKRLASIFDVGLSVWFTTFSKLVDRVTNLATEDILVPSFDNDLGLQEGVVDSTQVQRTSEIANTVIVYKNLYEMNANTNAALKPEKISYKDERNPIIRENNLIIGGKLKVYDVGALLWYSKQSSLEPALDINIAHDVKARNGDVIGYVGKPVGTAA